MGEDALSVLGTLQGKKAVITTGSSSMKKQGFLDKVTELLKGAGMEVAVFSGIESDPTVQTVAKGAKFLLEEEPDWLIALGGGSTIDATKAMWVFYEDPEAKYETLRANFPTLRKKARFVAIPSTSGTGSEVTYFAVITNPETHVKFPVAHPQLMPDIAILDPALVENLPKNQIANTGMDAMTHAVEAYVSLLRMPFTDAYAAKAIKMISDNIVASYNGDLKAREQMHYAQNMAGIAFNNALLGMVHAMAHSVGTIFSKHVPHGMGNAMYLPTSIRFNGEDEVIAARYAELARMLNLEGDSDAALVEAFAAHIEALNKELGIPTTLSEYGIGKEELTEHLETISNNALNDVNLRTNPRKIELDKMKELIAKIF
ncbi:MAG TPA: iron-containing alcohol dehydrogenase [Clostridiaceae bacterium]|nr:iron-containing alcohol dehydrogenase [Clostridiaceae bacterium]